MKRLDLILIIALSWSLSACNDGGGGGSSSSASSAVSAPADTTTTDGGNTTPSAGVSVTYYSLSNTEAPVSGWSSKTFTGVGSCAIVNSVTYCWDDGIKTISTWSFNSSFFGPYYNTFWGYQTSSSTCINGCTADFYSSPQKITATLMARLGASNINAVINTGTPTTVTCTDNGSSLDCGSFTISE